VDDVNGMTGVVNLGVPVPFEVGAMRRDAETSQLGKLQQLLKAGAGILQLSRKREIHIWPMKGLGEYMDLESEK
jgi:hypothetical protein